MGLKNINRFILNVVTLGEYSVSEDLLNELKKKYQEEYSPLEKKNKEYIMSNKKLLNNLFVKKSDLIIKFQKIGYICGNLEIFKISNVETISVSNDNLETISKINKTISIATPILAASTGATLGLGSAAGIWAITSTVGIASTGTPIILLNGIAATNAILAFIGGGSLAAGGLGMAGGISILGGIVAAPIAILTLYHTNKKVKISIEKYKSQINLMNENIPKLIEINSNYDKLNTELEKIICSLDNDLNIFLKKYNDLNDVLYPIPFLSKFFLKKFRNEQKYYKKYENQITDVLNISKVLIDKFFLI
ncbi:MAG: hypothetical protein ACRC6U_08460 [Fusobacteriaceae bacterium]